MEIPSGFYTWLCEQTSREDEVGQLATHAVNDPAWPKAESAKEPLRAYLRQKNLRDLVPLLAVTLREFDESPDSNLSVAPEVAKNLSFAFSRLAEPAFEAWLQLGCPTREEVEARAETDPAAQTILGVRVLLGVLAPKNRVVGARMLEAAVEAGFAPAAVVLERFYGIQLELEQSNEWLVRAAKLGDQEAICVLNSRCATAIVSQNAFPRPAISVEELRELAKDFEASGVLEYALAERFRSMDLEEVPTELYEQAAEKGHPLARYSGADFLRSLDQVEESEEQIREYADEGDALCQGVAAELDLIDEDGELVDLPESELSEKVRQLEIAAEHGLVHSILSLARMYREGHGVSRNVDQARVLLSAVLTTTSDATYRQHAAILLEEYAKGQAKAFGLEALQWLIASVEKTRAPWITRAAAQLWLALGMQLTRD